MTREQDIVLIHYEDTPLAFARIEDISADIKPDWYHVKLLMLQVPLQVVTWILKNDYINGAEFTMGGKKMRLERIECPVDEKPIQEEKTPEIKKTAKGGKVISLSDMKK